MSTYTFGKFTVREGLRHDNPVWPVYLVYLGDILIGKSFSMPDEGCCRWLERQRADEIRYAKESAPLTQWCVNKTLRKTHGSRGRPRKDVVTAVRMGRLARRNSRSSVDGQEKYSWCAPPRMRLGRY